MKVVKWFGFGLLMAAGLLMVPAKSTGSSVPCQDACNRYADSIQSACCDAHPYYCFRPLKGNRCDRERLQAYRLCHRNCN